MRRLRIIVVAVVGVAVLVFGSAHQSIEATPGAGGALMFSVEGIDPAHDISVGPNVAGDTCTSADLLSIVVLPGTMCAPRVPPAPPGPVPASFTLAPFDFGLNMGGPYTDDLDAISFGEDIGVTPTSDWDFSVDQALPNGGVTVGAPVPPPCAPFVPNVTTEAAGLEAQGDIFTTGGVPAGCNVQSPAGCPGAIACDEAALSLIAPNPGAPAMPPLDNVDALTEPGMIPGPCTLGGGAGTMSCAAFSVTAASAVLPAIPPDAFSGMPPNGATILAQPGTLPNPPGLPAGCPPGGVPCAVVHSSTLGLVAADDLDALCWFDLDGDLSPDLPTTIFPPGDAYIFSLTPGSPSVVGGGPWSAADLLTTGPPPGGPIVVASAASLGLLPTDDVDALICHQLNTDGDGLLDAFDAEDDGDGYTDAAEAGSLLCVGAVNNDPFDDAAINDGCPTRGFPEGVCGPAADEDGDTAINDGCPVVGIGAPPVSEGAANIGTNPLGPCAAGAVPNPSPSWPSDYISGSFPESTDEITISDLASFVVPMRRLDTIPGDAFFDPRWDLVRDSIRGGLDQRR